MRCCQEELEQVRAQNEELQQQLLQMLQQQSREGSSAASAYQQSTVASQPSSSQLGSELPHDSSSSRSSSVLEEDSFGRGGSSSSGRAEEVRELRSDLQGMLLKLKAQKTKMDTLRGQARLKRSPERNAYLWFLPALWTVRTLSSNAFHASLLSQCLCSSSLPKLPLPTCCWWL